LDSENVEDVDRVGRLDNVVTTVLLGEEVLKMLLHSLGAFSEEHKRIMSSSSLTNTEGAIFREKVKN
jgi:hypothetical protein